MFKYRLYFSKFLLLPGIVINTDNRIITAPCPIHMAVFHFLETLYVGRYTD